MSPLNHKRTTSSLVPPIFYVTKKVGIKKIEGFPLNFNRKFDFLNVTHCPNAEGKITTGNYKKSGTLPPIAKILIKPFLKSFIA